MVNQKQSNTDGMDRPLKIWEFFTGIFGVLVIVGTMIYNRGTMDEQNKVDIANLKLQMQEMKEQTKEQNQLINNKVDAVDGKVTNVLILLQNKQDRK